MFFNKDKKKSGFIVAKTPEGRRKQRLAIAAYYANKSMFKSSITKKKK